MIILKCKQDCILKIPRKCINSIYLESLIENDDDIVEIPNVSKDQMDDIVAYWKIHKCTGENIFSLDDWQWIKSKSLSKLISIGNTANYLNIPCLLRLVSKQCSKIIVNF